MRAWTGLLVAGCLRAGTYPLRPAGVDHPDLLAVTARATTVYSTARGTDLTVVMDIAWTGATRPRLDFARASVRADGGDWQPCRHGDTDPALLYTTLQPGDRISRTLTCHDISRPDHSLDLRFNAAAAGGTGVVVVHFDGMRRRGR